MIRPLHTNPNPVIPKPPPLNRDYKRDPDIRALERRGFTNHGSTLQPLSWGTCNIGYTKPGVVNRVLAELALVFVLSAAISYWFLVGKREPTARKIPV